MSTYDRLKQAGTQLWNDPLGTIRETSNLVGQSLSNQDLLEGVQTGGGVDGEGFLDQVERGFGALVDAKDWWSGGDPEKVAATKGAPGLAKGKDLAGAPSTPKKLAEQVVGAPGSDFSGEGTARSTLADEGEAEHDFRTGDQRGVDALKGLRGQLRGGKLTLGSEHSFELGENLEGKVNSSFDTSEGAFGLGGGLTWGSGSDDKGVSANAAIDFDDTRLIEGVGVGFGADVGPAELGAGAGVKNSLGDVEQLPDGRYQVSWQAGVGAGASAGLGEGSMGASAGLAQVATRTFASLEEANAYRDEVAHQVLPDQEMGVDAIKEMEPGESFSLQNGGDVGFDLSPKTLVGIDLGLGYSTTDTMELTKLEGDKVRATQTDGWSLEGKAGIAGLLAGATGALGWGNQSSSEIDFDLSKPGVAEAFEQYQATGELPEELMEGIEIQGKEEVDIETWGHEGWFLSESVKANARVEDGTTQVGDETWNVDRASRSEAHERSWFWSGTEEVSGEQHDFESISNDEQAYFGMRSTYRGEGALAAARADTDIGMDDIQARETYGTEAGTWTVDTTFSDAAELDLGRSAAMQLVGEDGAMAPYDIHEWPGFEDLCEQWGTSETVDMGPVAEYFATNGGDAAEMLRANTAEDKWVAYPGEGR